MAKFLSMLLLLLALPVMVPSGAAGSAQDNQTPKAEPKSPAQQAEPKSPTQHDTDVMSAEGDLSRVDAAKQLIWIKTADGKEMEFAYTKDTKVEGTGETVEGLAKDSGSHLKVDYNTVGGANHAVKIKVEPAKG